jgi:hypothetical protein
MQPAATVDICINFDQGKTIPVQTAKRRFAEFWASLDVVNSFMQVAWISGLLLVRWPGRMA